LHTQAAYNNTAEFELEENDVQSTVESASSQFPIGTKVAKQFDGDDQQLVWFEGTIQRFDEDDNLYWVLYTDGDSEDMEEAEVRDAVHNYRVHLQEDDVTGSAATSTAPSVTSVDVEMTDTSRWAVDSAARVGDTGAGSTSQSPSSPVSSELAIAVQAMTAAAKRLASAASRIEAAVETQLVERPQQPQQVVTVLHWQLHQHWQHVRLQQQQQQQQRLVYYQQQQQQLAYWPQQQQQQMLHFRWQCRR
jgi:Lamin-B receptor of TUDOR domain